MSEQNSKQFLGWGLVGTPAGRQYTSDGVDKQLNLGRVFELGQDLGACLPTPSTSELEPLYLLATRVEKNVHVLGMAEYFSIYEQGQTRAGTYFGAFIETVNSIFNPENVSGVFNTLRYLSFYQTQHFIDAEKKAYHTSIAGKAFEEPKGLDKIQLQALPQNPLTQVQPADFLFIHCQKGEAVKVAEKLLSSGLYRQFKDIFFTESEHISAQVRQMNRLQISSAQLLALDFFVEPWGNEVNYLHKVIHQLQANQKNAEAEIQRLNREQVQIVDEKVAQKAQEYQQQVIQAEKERDEAEDKAKKLYELAGFGTVELQKFTTSVAEQAVPLFNDAVERKLHEFNAKFAQSMQSLASKVEQPPQPKSDNLWTIIWGAVSAVLFVILLGSFVWTYFSSDKVLGEKEFNELNTKANTLPQKENEIQKLNAEVEHLKRENAQLTEQVRANSIPLEEQKSKGKK